METVAPAENPEGQGPAAAGAGARQGDPSARSRGGGGRSGVRVRRSSDPERAAPSTTTGMAGTTPVSSSDRVAPVRADKDVIEDSRGVAAEKVVPINTSVSTSKSAVHLSVGTKRGLPGGTSGHDDALAAFAGVMNGLYYNEINFGIGLYLGVVGFSAAIIGGLGSIYGAILGGFLFAGLQTIGTVMLPFASAYKDVFAFAVVIAIMAWRPTGLIREKISERV